MKVCEIENKYARISLYLVLVVLFTVILLPIVVVLSCVFAASYGWTKRFKEFWERSGFPYVYTKDTFLLNIHGYKRD